MLTWRFKILNFLGVVAIAVSVVTLVRPQLSDGSRPEYAGDGPRPAALPPQPRHDLGAVAARQQHHQHLFPEVSLAEKTVGKL